MAARVGEFTALECNRIIKAALQLPIENANIGEDPVENHEYRRNRIAWINRGGEFDWVITKLQNIVERINWQFYRFDIVGFEPIQFTIYDDPGDFYSAHIDINHNSGLMRKISLIVQLSDETTYQGGELEIFHTEHSYLPATNKQGSVIAFPSFLVHRIKPITKGKRYSLVAWAVGPDFK